ncbi:MAG: aminomethyltransferase family protein [Phycisphaerales bacterium]|nr:aminomethyltransferase family protein [Phycisphaerales bacterium]MCB9836635.1 aminomethyl transferase family protein [Phycisphaera sp.]
MANPSPLRAELLRRNAELAPYGPPDAGVEVAQTLGPVELEYAALRKNCVLIDQPHRGTVQMTGTDRIEFLNRMLTQELKPLDGGAMKWAESFWLSRKGRIDADVRVIGFGDRVLFDVDVHQAAHFVATLDAYIFAEDAVLKDVSQSMHRVALIGPKSARLLELAAGETKAGKAAHEIESGETCEVVIAGRAVYFDRSDAVGVPAFGLVMSKDDAEAVYTRLCELGMPDGQDEIGQENAGLNRGEGTGMEIGLRVAGWHAYNIARIEAGEPVFNLDFGTTSLPGETGVMHRRVSFKKGCYLGQEIVARMDALGHPKQTVVALRVGSSPDDPQPVTGSELVAAGQVVGAVTSSTVSPMLGGQVICLASVRWDFHEPGTNMVVRTDEGEVAAVIQEGLKFLRT